MAPELVDRFLKSSLRRLQLDYVDLYLVHWPLGLKYISEEKLMPMDESGNVIYDTTTDLEAVWKEMERHVESGEVKNIGISNFNEKQIERIMKIAKIRPANHQVHIYNCRK